MGATEETEQPGASKKHMPTMSSVSSMQSLPRKGA